MLTDLAPVAEALLFGRAYTAAAAADHLAALRYPMTSMARAHLMRSVVQALVVGEQVTGYSLVDSYLAFGRVEVIADTTGQHYLLKSKNALPFELAVQAPLFDSDELAEAPPLRLLLYRFRGDDLSLATLAVEKVRLRGRNRFRAIGAVEDTGTWAGSEFPDVPTFDPGVDDDFGDLSDGVQLEGEDGEGVSE